MEIVIGWSTQYANDKFSIGVNDTDFLQIMTEQDVGAALAAQVTFFDKFRLLEATARYLSEAESLRVISDPDRRARAQQSADTAKAELGTILNEIKTKLGLVQPPPQQQEAQVEQPQPAGS